MKKIFILAAILVLSAPVFAAIDTWFNTNPHKSYNKEITLQEVLKIEKLNEQDIQNRINSKVQEEEEKAKDLQSLGYNIYSRDTSSDIYKLENSTEFYLSANALYIIYAYGNEANTSEMDLVIL